MTKKPDLNGDEEKQADEYENVPSSVIFEAIRREAEHELSRGFGALWWSGVAAGLAISVSVICKGFLESILPDADWAAGVSNLGYTVGFLIVILGRMQLFTENTITPILPDARFEGVLSVSRHYAEATVFQHFAWGIPAGFIIAALVWILPRMESAGEVLMIVILTYMIGLGGMSHVVAGSTDKQDEELFLSEALSAHP